jgi:hypothetical protein
MGKAKKRSFHLGINRQISNMSRESAIEEVIHQLKLEDDKSEAYSLITLFGMSAEELLEAGGSYETVMSLRGIVKE